MPGPACEPDSGNLEASPGEGFIHVQRGIHGIGDLAADVYDWRNPVAEVFLRRLWVDLLMSWTLWTFVFLGVNPAQYLLLSLQHRPPTDLLFDFQWQSVFWLPYDT